jgi:hypothetical protein
MAMARFFLARNQMEVAEMSTSGEKRVSEVMGKAKRHLAVTYRQTAELKLDPNKPAHPYTSAGQADCP